MKRTHIMHARDNRRPIYFAQRDHNDARPVLAWLCDGMCQIMTLDGVPVARVEPVGDPSWNRATGDTYTRHDAIIIAGPMCGTRKAFPDDCDSARLFCEAMFAA